MTTPTIPQHPLSAALNKAGEAKRLNVDNARAAVDAVESISAAADDYTQTNTAGLSDDFDAILLSLGELVDNQVGISQEDFEKVQQAMQVITNLLPDAATIQDLVDAHQEAEDKVTICEEHKDSERGEYDADTKADARDECQEALIALASALDDALPVEPVETGEVEPGRGAGATCRCPRRWPG